VQYPVENPRGGKPNVFDFAISDLKIGIEADGEMWHSQPEQEKDDRERDQLLAQRGWTILRFDDKVIDDAPQAVKSTISSHIKRVLDKNTKKEASSNAPNIHLITIISDNVVDLGMDYDLYQINKMYSGQQFGGKEHLLD
jgi:hypothetical protein